MYDNRGMLPFALPLREGTDVGGSMMTGTCFPQFCLCGYRGAEMWQGRWWQGRVSLSSIFAGKERPRCGRISDDRGVVFLSLPLQVVSSWDALFLVSPISLAFRLAFYVSFQTRTYVALWTIGEALGGRSGGHDRAEYSRRKDVCIFSRCSSAFLKGTCQLDDYSIGVWRDSRSLGTSLNRSGTYLVHERERLLMRVGWISRLPGRGELSLEKDRVGIRSSFEGGQEE